jgi:iron(III) transport system substrate-binding protein
MRVSTRSTRARHGTFSRLTPFLAPLLAMTLAACSAGGTSGGASPTPTSSPQAAATAAAIDASSAPATAAPVVGTVRLYTTVQQPTVDAITAALAEVHPGLTLETFRAPTGEVAARIAAEEREGVVRADILWLTDPLSIEGYAARGLLREWVPVGAAALDPAFVAPSYWGTRVLNMVIVRAAGAEGPTSWKDLLDPGLRDAVAIPDPAFAGSAFGALGYFAQNPAFGLDFYRSLRANGTVQLQAPDEVTTAVAEGRFKAGITLDFSARAAEAKGSPVELVWPEEGSIALFGPVAVVDTTENAETSEAFVEFLLSEAGQAAIGGTGWEPVLPGVGGPEPGGGQLRPDWPAVFGRQQELLAEYATIFGD